MYYRLISPDGTQSFDLKMNAPQIVGRAPTGGVVGPTIVREMSLRDRRTPFTSLGAPTTAPGGMTRVASPLSAPPSDKSQQKLATLLEVAKGLTRAVDVDAILAKIVAYAY